MNDLTFRPATPRTRRTRCTRCATQAGRADVMARELQPALMWGGWREDQLFAPPPPFPAFPPPPPPSSVCRMHAVRPSREDCVDMLNCACFCNTRLLVMHDCRSCLHGFFFCPFFPFSLHISDVIAACA